MVYGLLSHFQESRLLASQDYCDVTVYFVGRLFTALSQGDAPFFDYEAKQNDGFKVAWYEG